MLEGCLVGFGAIAENAHVPAFAGRKDMRLVAVVELSTARRDAARKLLPKARVYSDFEEMLSAEKNLGFVVICTPPNMHAKQASAALKRGLHVLCEKPLTLDPQELETLASLATNSILFTVHNWAYSPHWLAFEKLARADGPLKTAALLVKRTRPSVSALADDWRRDLSRAGGGIVVDHGWHNLYLLSRLFDAEPTLVETRLTRGESGADEEAKLVLDFDGARADLFMTWRSSARSNYVAASSGDKVFELRDDRIIVSRDGKELKTQKFDQALSAGSAHPEWLSVMLDDFAAALKGGPEGPRNLREARLCARLIAQAYGKETAPAPVAAR